MERIDRVLITVLALSDKGNVEAGPRVEVVATRMKEFDYTPVTDASQPYDAELKIKCEQKKNWEGTTTMGSDADLPDAPSRIWKGPACQLGYLLNGKKMAWRKEVRTDFDGEQVRIADESAGEPAGEIPGPELDGAAVFFQRSGGLTGELLTVRIYADGTIERAMGEPSLDLPVETAVVDPAVVETLTAGLEEARLLWRVGRMWSTLLSPPRQRWPANRSSCLC